MTSESHLTILGHLRLTKYWTLHVVRPVDVDVCVLLVYTHPFLPAPRSTVHGQLWSSSHPGQYWLMTIWLACCWVIRSGSRNETSATVRTGWRVGWTFCIQQYIQFSVFNYCLIVLISIRWHSSRENRCLADLVVCMPSQLMILQCQTWVTLSMMQERF